MADGQSLDDYVEVAERLRQFFDRFPEGSLQAAKPPYFETVGDTTFLVYTAAAYRTPNDERPGIGTAWEVVPGRTPWTRFSEIQNAETSAWGRACVAVGLESKRIATAEDVRNARAAQGERTEGASDGEPGGSAFQAPSEFRTDSMAAASLTDPQRRKIYALIGKLKKADVPGFTDDAVRLALSAHYGTESISELTRAQAGELIDRLETKERQSDL